MHIKKNKLLWWYTATVGKKVIKRNGVVVDFDRTILERSLSRAGAPRDLAHSIGHSIESSVKDGDTTSVIYKRAFEMLYEQARHIAMRYSLKKALFGFGPTGFPFEKFIAEIYRRKGYATQTNVHLRGSCISHEVDVLAIKSERVGMEVKFHNDMHIRSDVKAVLYAKARFDDLIGRSKFPISLRRNVKGAVDRCILVTNTKFTKNALSYAKCAGVTLLGWGYPFRSNLQTYIQEVDAHPVTCLPSLSASLARNLFSEGVVTCKGLLEREDLLRALPNTDTIVSEAEMLCTPDGRN